MRFWKLKSRSSNHFTWVTGRKFFLKARRERLGYSEWCTTCHSNTRVARNYPCVTTDQVLYLCCLFPRDHKSLERSCSKRKRRYPRRLERKCYRWTQDPCRYRIERVQWHHCRIERRVYQLVDQQRSRRTSKAIRHERKGSQRTKN